jgi:hypothetical protein
MASHKTEMASHSADSSAFICPILAPRHGDAEKQILHSFAFNLFLSLLCTSSRHSPVPRTYTPQITTNQHTPLIRIAVNIRDPEIIFRDSEDGMSRAAIRIPGTNGLNKNRILSTTDATIAPSMRKTFPAFALGLASGI